MYAQIFERKANQISYNYARQTYNTIENKTRNNTKVNRKIIGQ